MTGRRYLDYNATAPLHPEARRAMTAALDICGNPSSVHAEGRRARALVEEARAAVAGVVGARSRDVVFASGGTEAAALALAPGVTVPGRRPVERLLIGAVEHACVLTGHRFPSDRVVSVPVDAHGRIRLDALERMLAEEGCAMLALQAANNETGVLQPVADAARLVRAQGGILVCDAVQALGRIDLAGDALGADLFGADLLILSAHKVGGPKGVGALVRRNGAEITDALLRGGGQERGLRAGTENVAAIAGFGAVCAALDAGDGRIGALRDRLEQGLVRLAPSVTIFGREVPRLSNTTAFAVPAWPAETLLIGLDLAGVAVSSGSACSSGKVGRSHVLAAMGVRDDLAQGAIRTSLGWASTEADVAAFEAALALCLARSQPRQGRAA